MGLPPLLCAYALGIALTPVLPFHSAWIAAPLAVAICWFRLRRHHVARLLLPLFTLLLGIALGQLQLLPPSLPNDIGRLNGKSEAVKLTARIVRVDQRPETGMALLVEALQVDNGTTAASASGRLRLSIAEGRLALRPGDIILCRTRLYAPRTFRTPGEFDFPRHLAAQGIFTTGFVPNSDEIVLLDAPASRFQLWLQHRRSAVGAFIDSHVEPLWAPLVKALTIGTQSDIDAELRRRLTYGGVWHLFAISGSHLALIAGLILWAGSALWRRSETLLLWSPPLRVVPLLALPLLFCFYLWTGEGVATLRALLMFAVVAILFATVRFTSPWQILVVAAGAILLFSPLTLFEPGFQLSAAGVAGIALVLPRMSTYLDPLPRLLRWPAILLGSTVGATLATLPLVLLHFRLLAPAGLLTNLLAVPLVGFIVVPTCLLATLFTEALPALAIQLFGLSAELLKLLTGMVDIVSSWPALAGRIVYLTPLELVAVALAVGAILLPWSTRWKVPRLAMGLIAIAVLLLPPLRPPAPSLIVLSVGQGESLLLTLSDGRHYLIDGGGLYGSNFDTGERLVAPALARLGIKRLAGIIMSHAHPDHSQGLAYILATMPVDSFWQASDEELPAPLNKILTERSIPIRLAPPGWSEVLRSGRDRITLFHPCLQTTANDHSLVTLADLDSDTLLLCGDIEARAVAELAAQTPNFAPTLLKLPHHGSRHSAPEQLLDHFPAQLAVVSVGRDNRFGFPHEATLQVLQRHAVPLARTDRDGTLLFHPQERQWRVERWNNGDFH